VSNDESLPPYQRISQHYRELIGNGSLRDGDRLPSVRELAEQWHVAHATAAKVMSTLRSEGLVTTSTGGAGGTIVSAKALGRSPKDHAASTRKTGRIYPTGNYARIVSAELVDAPEGIAVALGVEAGSRVIRRRRVTYSGDTPVSASTSWFRGDLADTAPNLLLAERIILGTPGYIERQTGRVLQRGLDQFTAAVADEVVAGDLEVPAGSPVLVGRNWFRDGDGEVIEYGEYVSVAGRWQTYEYDVELRADSPVS
jgi:DNA-binding GntR family transcriptional regulator